MTPFTSPDLLPIQTAIMTGEKIDDGLNWGDKMVQNANKNVESASRWTRWTRDFILKHKNKILALAKATVAFNKTMRMIARFYPLIILILIILAFFGKPLEYIMLFLAAVIVSIIWIIVFILGQPVLRVIPYLPYALFKVWIPWLAYSILISGIFLVLLIVCLVLAIANEASGGKLKNLVLCQNSPEAWFKVSSFQHKNIFKRGFFCSRPCLSRYKPDQNTQGFCEKLKRDTPGFCPNSEIMRIYTGFKRKDRVYTFKSYSAKNPKYYFKSPMMREGLLRDSFMRRRKFLEQCEKPMAPYKNLTLNICSSTDAYLKTRFNGMDDKAIKRLRNVCGAAYCSASSNYPFCNKLANSSDMDSSMLVKQIIKIILSIIIFFVILIFVFNYMFRQSI